MSERKSRRRFLADLLFLGGGLTAASLVAGTVLRESSSTVVEPALFSDPPHPPLSNEPIAAGEMEIPDSDFTDQKSECETQPDKPQKPQLTERDPFSQGGEDTPPVSKGAVPAYDNIEPAYPGRYIVPSEE